MTLRSLICVALFVSSAASSASAAPFVPASDNQILEHLPFAASDRKMRELRALRDGLKNQPENLPLALRVARGYLELGRATGDPRYGSYAQASLAPWWDLQSPPPKMLILRATLLQRVHRFDAALADLARLLEADPRDAQARLMRATVLQVIGNFDASREECIALGRVTIELVWTACLDNVNSATGKLHEAYEQLRATLERFPHAQSQLRSWVLTSLGEMAARAGRTQEAEDHFRQALAIDATDNYILAAFADFLLDQDRPMEVRELLTNWTRQDPLLLRYALALKAQRSPGLPERIEQLRDRFEAARLRGDRVHLREEARFTLHLINDANTALSLARDNWRVQKEPADIRVLLEAAVAAQSKADGEVARDWLSRTGMEDVWLHQLVADSKALK